MTFSHDFFSTSVLIQVFSGLEKSEDKFPDFSEPMGTLTAASVNG